MFAAGICCLFLLNRDREVHTSPALYAPVIWVLIAGSRMVSQWLQGSAPDVEAVSLDGSPLDRNILAGLILIGLCVLFSRRPRVVSLLRENLPILLFVSYCAVSVLWSDYPDISFKRWIKSLGDLVMILVVVTDRQPVSAIKRLVAWTGFLLIPLSILFIKYYPDLGGGYASWSSTPVWTGVTTNKNTLGMVCLVLGIGVSWRLLEELQREKSRSRSRAMLAQGILLVSTLWLLWISNSMTSLACFLMAVGLMLAMRFGHWDRTRTMVHMTVGVAILASFSVLFLGVGMGLMNVMGRESTLTGRTDIWSYVLGMGVNPLCGTGFESFWMGPRLASIGAHFWWQPNEAHNGYLEIYLNLGWIGVILLAGILVAGYQKIEAAVYREDEAGILRLAYFVAAIAYNFTEAGFRMLNLVWFFLLLSIIGTPRVVEVADYSSETEDDLLLSEGHLEQGRYSGTY